MSQAWDFPPSGDDPSRIWSEIKDALRFKPSSKLNPVRGKGRNKENWHSPAEKPKGPPGNENAEVEAPPPPRESSETKEPRAVEPNKTVSHDDGCAGLIDAMDFWADKSPEDTPEFKAACRSSYGLDVYPVDMDYEPEPGRSRVSIDEEMEYLDGSLSWEQTSFFGQDTPQSHSSDDDSRSSTTTTTSSTEETSYTESWRERK